MRGLWALGVAAAAWIAADGPPATAQETLRVAASQKGNWEQSVSELGQDAGFFRKHGLQLDIVYTAGTGETVQAVVSGAADLGSGVGTSAALGLFAKGAPIRAIGSQTIGANEVFWYVPSNSAIKTFQDAANKTVAFSTRGSSTYDMAAALSAQYKVATNLVATGAVPATYTQVMSGQIDIGYSVPPVGLAAIEEGKIRVIARGSEIPDFRDQSVRLLVANSQKLAAKQDQVVRYLKAYQETLDWMYSTPEAINAYSVWARVPSEIAAKMKGFYPKAALVPSKVTGIESLMRDAIKGKYMPAELTDAQLGEFFQLTTYAK